MSARSRWVSQLEAARLLDLDVRDVKTMVESGRIQAIDVGNVLVRLESVRNGAGSGWKAAA